jgi:hypothetical protein
MATMNDEPVTAEEISDWARHVSALHEYTVREPGDYEAASRSVAAAWSGYGQLDAPAEVQEMLTEAMEAGYCLALTDARAGQLNSELGMQWP